MIEALHHIQLAMPEGLEAEAVDFYEGVLGLQRVEKPGALAGRGGVWFERNGVRVHLGVDQSFVPARKAHPGFEVGDLEETVTRLNATGIAFDRDVDLPDISRIYVHDPFGNRIELLQRRWKEESVSHGA